MVDCVVDYDYIAGEDDELTIKKGDVITDVIKHDGGWWEGTLNGKKGMFPDNFVKELKKEKVKEKKASGSSSSGHVAELASKLGREGLKVGGAPGAPTSAKRDKDKVNAGSSAPGDQKPSAGVRPPRARAAHTYGPQNEDELELKVGDVLTVTNQEEEGWWEGTNADGKSGMFPSNFVELIKDEDEDENALEVHEIHGKKIKGVGFGNIFAGGPVKLKGSQKRPQENSDHSSDISIKSSQELKVKKSAPPATPKDAPQLPPKDKPVERARVLYSYTAENEDELSLAEGAVLTVLDKHLVDAGWWKGELGGKVGVFPDNFVELLPQEEAKPRRPAPPSTPTAAAAASKKSPHVSPAKHKTGSSAPVSAARPRPLAPPPLGKKPGKADPKLIAQTDDSKAATQTEKDQSDSPVALDAVESTERLSHPTAGRVKAPVRRPPTITAKDAAASHVEGSLSAAGSQEELDADLVSPRGEVTTPRSEVTTPRGGSVKRGKPLRRGAPPVPPTHEEPPAEEADDDDIPEEAAPAPPVPPPSRRVHQVKQQQQETAAAVSPRQSPRDPDTDTAQQHFERGPSPASSAAAADDADLDSLRRQLAELRASTVPRRQHEELAAELAEFRAATQRWQSKYHKLLADLVEEVDEEKKIRLATDVEIKRIKKLVQL